MTEKRRCIRCQRPIDAYARICPYCNWDQTDSSTPPVPGANEQTYVAPNEHMWRKYAFMTLGGIALLIASFALGSKIQGKKPVKGLENAQSIEERTATQAPVRPPQQSDVHFVPDNGTDTGFERPITSAPAATQAEGVPPEYQRSDATAVSSVEYAQLAARANEEKKRQKAAVDPRSLTGAAYEQGTAPRKPAAPKPEPQFSSTESSPQDRVEPPPAREPTPSREPARIVVSTRPVPEYQPIPKVSVSQTSIVRLQLTVGADGSVKEVNILQGIPGETSNIVSTVQTWRFKPATENGTPVSAPFTVDLSFRGNG